MKIAEKEISECRVKILEISAEKEELKQNNKELHKQNFMYICISLVVLLFLIGVAVFFKYEINLTIIK